MNNIIYAGAADAAPARCEKVFRILLPASDGEIKGVCYSAESVVVLPPLVPLPTGFCGSLIALERALIPLKTPAVFAARSEIEFVFSQATRDSSSPERRSGLILAALGELLAAYATSYCTTTDTSPLIERLREEIERNLSDPTFSLDGYMKSIPLNYDYLRKLFKAQTGMTPHDYLISRRMQLAANMLSGSVLNRYSKYSVAQVAEACGFYEPLYFSRVFRKHFGVSPSEYRQS